MDSVVSVVSAKVCVILVPPDEDGAPPVSVVALVTAEVTSAVVVATVC